MPQMIDCTDFNLNSTAEGFWTCLMDRIGAGSFDTPEIGAPVKHRWELFFAQQDSPIAREIMSEIGRAKASFLEALEQLEDPSAPPRRALQGAEVDLVSDTGDHCRSLHDYMLQFVATELERSGAKYLVAAKKGYKSTDGIFTHVLQQPMALLEAAAVDKAYQWLHSSGCCHGLDYLSSSRTLTRAFKCWGC